MASGHRFVKAKGQTSSMFVWRKKYMSNACKCIGSVYGQTRHWKRIMSDLQQFIVIYIPYSTKAL